MVDQSVECLIVTEPLSYFYFTGHKSASASNKRPTILILPLESDPVQISWETERMWLQIDKTDFLTWISDVRSYPDIPFSKESPVDWGIKSVLEEKGVSEARVAIELGDNTFLRLPVNDFEKLKRDLPKAKFIDSGPITWSCRMIKSDWEIQMMENACEIGGKAWSKCISELGEGMTQNEIMSSLREYCEEGGGDYKSTYGFAKGATGSSGSFRKGDVLYLDGGCTYSQYMMDITRRVVFGPPNERQAYEHRVAWDTFQRMVDAIKPGVKVCELFNIAQIELKKAGVRSYSDHPAKRIGHGIGLESEPPSVNGVDETPLEENMVLTPEPKFFSVDGLVQSEQQVVVTKNGYRIISPQPDSRLFVVE